MNSKSMAGWIGFAGSAGDCRRARLLSGSDRPVRGRVLRRHGSGFLVFDLTAWGWTMMIWGVLLVTAGFGLAAGLGWRAVAIVVVGLNFIAQLGFLGNSQTRSGH